MEAVRIRLRFDGGRILSKPQRREGLKRSWLLLKPQHQTTISDVVSHLLSTFNLHDSCPNGLILYMDDFVLPPFESTTILKDKDLICVKRKGEKVSTVINAIEGARTSQKEVVLRKLPLVPATRLLANEEYDNGTGSYQSESEEETHMLLVDSTQDQELVSKKRKASKNFESSKRKKLCQHANKSVESSAQDKDIECFQPDDGAHKKRKSSMPDSKPVHEDGKGISTLSDMPVEKSSSRSARRKKVKRQWLKEIKKAEQQKLLGRCLPEKDVNSDAKKVSEVNRTAELQKISLPIKDRGADSGPTKYFNVKPMEHPQPDEDSDADNEITPIVVRPGHIRFAPYGKDEDAQKNQDAKEQGTFQWNGITNKRKGQKWGKQTHSVPQRYQPCFNRDYSHRQEKEKRPVNDQAEFEKLVLLVDSPQQGDIIVYRLLELSSSFCPELSSFRVGKVSWFDPESNRIMLVQVSEYPIKLEKKSEECALELPFETSQYKDDGSLEIDFHSLVNVRIMKRGSPSPPEADPTVVVQALDADGQSSTSRVCTRGLDETPLPNGILSAPGTQTVNNKKEVLSWASGKGDVDPWEELSQALDAKKTELQQNDKWNKKGNSEKPSWSYRSSQRSALGPTLNRLREQNGV